jgi:carboxypeptidase family protein
MHRAVVAETARSGAKLAGRVLDATGGPIAGASLVAGVSGATASVRSGEDGAFELYLPRGSNLVRVGADGYSEYIRQLWAPSADLELVLTPASSISGRVLSEAHEAPLSNVTVHVVNGNGLRVASRIVRSRPDGSFDVPDLPAGDYSLSVVDQRWRSDPQSVTVGVSDSLGSVILLARSATYLSGRILVGDEPCMEGWLQLSGPISVVADVDSAGDVRADGLLPGVYAALVSCTGSVQRSEEVTVLSEPIVRTWVLDAGLSLRGLVQTDAGERVPGVAVLVIGAGDGDLPSARCVSNDVGEFECTGLRAGAYECWLARTHPIGTPERVQLGESEAPLVVLRSSASGTIRASVAGGRNELLASLGATAAPANGGPAVSGRFGEGGVTFEDLELGAYEVSLGSSRGGKTVTLARAGEIVEVELEDTARATILGTVVDERGAPIVDAWVQARVAPSEPGGTLSGPAPVLTDEEGAFALVDLITGAYDIEVSANGARGALLGVRSGAVSAVVHVVATASLQVGVSSSSGVPVESFSLAYQRQGDVAVTTEKATGDTWQIQSIEPGRYRVAVTTAEGAAMQSVEVPAAGTVKLPLEVSSTPTQVTPGEMLAAMQSGAAGAAR